MRGLTVAVTGANRGLGRAIAERAADAGADLLLLGRDLDALRGVAAATGGEVRYLDLADPATIGPALSGRVDVLVNNGGVTGPIGPSWEVADRDWWEAMEVNVRGTVQACHAVLPGMLARHSGRVINIVSNAGRLTWPSVSSYSVSKAAVIKFTENVAEELRNRGVSVFSFHPGLLDIGMAGGHLNERRSTDPWRNQIRIWLRMERKAGRFTPLSQALETLLLLLDGTADPLSGSYLTADDDIAALVKEKS
ncbi:SDR family NAD(P)-dependent oxidoreductase [Lentzea tibetensis]|uniref:SDR family NAD(P)-dependent oxidoreductase n=1 Tax=Lentzea tibetensis TaxID=2591470 RepID=UPI001C99A448|nr:SDR family NAD(P)-dependent oxidoreductase [Lentzea tibetensis]